MSKPLVEYQFREVEGLWKDVKGEGVILADVLSLYNIIIDDRTQFARLYDYERMIYFEYRAYFGKIMLTLYRIYKQ